MDTGENPIGYRTADRLVPADARAVFEAIGSRFPAEQHPEDITRSAPMDSHRLGGNLRRHT